jgi:RNA polymerase sigma-70 factor, ECF subfamily
MSTVTLHDQTYHRLRPYLFAVAYRMTGSASDAEDLVHDAWVRYLDAGRPAVDSLRAYLTTVVSRLALDYLKSARVQREQHAGSWMPEPVLTSEAVAGPAEAVVQREAISLALLTLLERLTPEQRVVYVLREGFDLPYDEIAGHVGKSAAACRQMFRRARRLLEEQRPRLDVDASRQQPLIERFFEAFARADTAAVAGLLADDAIWMADGGRERLSIRRPVHGRDRVARGLAGVGRKYAALGGLAVRWLDVNGGCAVGMFDRDRLERVFTFDIVDGRIAAVRVLLDPDKLQHLAQALGTTVAPAAPWAVPPSSRAANSAQRSVSQDPARSPNPSR